MQGVIIEIDAPSVWKEVKKISEYTGAHAATEVDIYDNTRLTEDDIDTLERFFRETAAILAGSVSEMLRDAEINARHLKLYLDMADKWNTKHLKSLTQALISYCACSILSKWFRMTLPDAAEAYSAEAQGYLTTAGGFLYARVRPVRPEKRTTKTEE